MNQLGKSIPIATSAAAALSRIALGQAAMASAQTRRGIWIGWARHQDDVREAQRLRFQVFADEMGARLGKGTPGHDVDLFDDYCEHLLVRDSDSQDVIGTYRVLTPAQARRVGGTYTDTEFDLTRLRGLRERMVELGRSCVHPDHRRGSVILALWGALGESDGDWVESRTALVEHYDGSLELVHWVASHASHGLGHETRMELA